MLANTYSQPFFFPRAPSKVRDYLTQGQTKNVRKFALTVNMGSGLFYGIERVLSENGEYVLFNEPSKVQRHYFQRAQVPSHTDGIFITLISLSFVFCLQWLLFQIKNPVFFHIGSSVLFFTPSLTVAVVKGNPQQVPIVP